MGSKNRIHIQVEADHVRSDGISDPGLLRAENEDSIFIDEAGRFMLLADGMGGHERGAEASRTALEVIQEHFKPENMFADLQEITDGSGIPSEIACLLNVVEDAVGEANKIVHERNLEKGLERFMGTTLVGLVLIKDTYVLWFHIGDSRLYRWRDSRLTRLTTDHSAYFEWVKGGRKGDEPKKNVITRAVGPKSAVSPEIGWDEWVKDDQYLLCSDGLTDVISEEQVTDVLSSGVDFKFLSDRLIKAAIDGGGKDNVSVILCRI